MALVDHDEGVVFFGEVADFVHGGDVAVHGEDAVGGDDAESLGLGLFEALFELVHVSVGIAVAFGFAEAHAVDDGGVVEGVGDDGVLFGEEGLEEASVGVEAGGVEDGVLGVEVFGDGALELFVEVLGAADEAHGTHAVAVGVHGGFGGGDEARIVGEAEVVVGAEVEDVALGALHFYVGALGGCDDSLVLVEAGVADALKLGLEVFFEVSIHIIAEFLRC